MEDQGGSRAERFSVVGEPLAKCVIPRCKIWVNSRWKVEGEWYPICTYDHRIQQIMNLSGHARSYRTVETDKGLMKMLGR